MRLPYLAAYAGASGGGGFFAAFKLDEHPELDRGLRDRHESKVAREIARVDCTPGKEACKSHVSLLYAVVVAETGVDCYLVYCTVGFGAGVTERINSGLCGAAWSHEQGFLNSVRANDDLFPVLADLLRAKYVLHRKLE